LVVEGDGQHSACFGCETPSLNLGWAKVIDIVGSVSSAVVIRATSSTQEASMGSAGIGLYYDVAGAASAVNNNISFMTEETNSQYTATQRAHITSTGKFIIGATQASSALLSVISGGSTAGAFGGPVFIDVDGSINKSWSDLQVQSGATYSTYNAGDADWATSSDSTLKTSLDTINTAKLVKLRSIFEDSLHVWRYKWKPEALESPETIATIWEDTLKIPEIVNAEVEARGGVTGIELAAIQDSVDLAVWAQVNEKLAVDEARVARGASRRHVGLIAQEAEALTRLIAPEELRPGEVNGAHVKAGMMQMVIDLARRMKEVEAELVAAKARIAVLEAQ
jgi:hypothetical protein